MTPPTLLLIAHGSRSSVWNQEIEKFVNDLRHFLMPDDPVARVAHCYLEYAGPSIPQALAALCGPKHPKIFALPLFLSVSEHVLHDIPGELRRVARFLSEEEHYSLYKCSGSRVYLLPPPPTPCLLADNLARRLQKQVSPLMNLSVILVYYGSKRYLASWERLAQATRDQLGTRLPEVRIDWTYGGDAVAFSPQLLADKIRFWAQRTERVVVLPALVSLGMIQTEVIPQAVELSGCADRVSSPADAVLPDPELAGGVLDYVKEILAKI